MEGKKAFILPAVAAVVFGGLLYLRSSAEEIGAGSDTPASDGATVAERVRNAIAADPSAKLKLSALSKLQPAIESAAGPCRSHAPGVPTVRLSVDVAAAAGVGSIVEAAEPADTSAFPLPAAATDCLRTTLRTFVGPDVGQTGRLSTTMQLSFGDASAVASEKAPEVLPEKAQDAPP